MTQIIKQNHFTDFLLYKSKHGAISGKFQNNKIKYYNLDLIIAV